MRSAFHLFQPSSAPTDMGAPSESLIGPKVAATLVLCGAVLAALVAPALTLKMPGNHISLDAQIPPVPARVVDAGSRSEIPCAQQTWPYIDARCLKQGSTKIATAPAAPLADTSKPDSKAQESKAQDSKPDIAKLEPQPASSPTSAPAATTATIEPATTAALPAGSELDRVPLPPHRPAMAEAEAEADDGSIAPLPMEQRRIVRSRRSYDDRRYYDDPRDHLVRQLNRVIPFGIFRF